MTSIMSNQGWTDGCGLGASSEKRRPRDVACLGVQEPEDKLDMEPHELLRYKMRAEADNVISYHRNNGHDTLN
jgi:hypothetical protein